MSRLLIATGNPGKRKELEVLLQGHGIELVTLADFPELKEVEETGESFMENAHLKAITYAQATGLWTLGDDSGLEVRALDGAPGVHSARFAGEEKNDIANTKKLLKLLHRQSERGARFQTAMALANPDGVQVEATGILNGIIIECPKGEEGFGYDPVFVPVGEGRTLAQMAPEEKNAISHRARALHAIEGELKRLLKEEG